MTGPKTAAEAVANGAQLLDEKVPGWWRKIDKGLIEMEHCDKCICGQLALDMYDEAKRREIHPWVSRGGAFSSYYSYFLAEELGLEEDAEHGFSIQWDYDEDVLLYDWEDLEAEWKLAIDARLEADKLAVVPEREEVCV